jgi:N-6 DNA Methylase
VPDAFDRAFLAYIARWSEARTRRASHDQLRHLFTAFLGEAYPGLQAWEFELEQHLTGLGVRGFIDLLYRDLIFEFKRDLAVERDAGLEELGRYLGAQPEPHRAIGLLTEGGRFEVYALRGTELVLVDEFRLEAERPEDARLALDSYLFADRSIRPTAEDIVRRFGEHSPVYVATGAALRDAYTGVRGSLAVDVKFREWDNLLAHVYGTRVGSEELFLRHTYLVLLTRLIGYIALRGRPAADGELAGVVDGAAFEPFGISNIVEEDFFVWVLEPPILEITRRVLRGLAAHLAVYDFQGLTEDVLKELYQHLVDPEARHDLGEYYTPDWLAERTLREIGFGPGQSLLDPACGSGTFLFTAVRLLREAGVEGEALLRFVFENLAGSDVHPVAVMISKVNLVLALLPDLRGQSVAGLGPLPVFMADALHVATAADAPGIRIAVHLEAAAKPATLPGEFVIPPQLAADPVALDAIIARLAELSGESDAADEALVGVLRTSVASLGYAVATPYLISDFKLLRWLKASGRDSVWAFILRNAYRPSYFAQRKFDVVAGNPPWLSHRYIARGDYQQEIRRLVRAYGLMDLRKVWEFSQIELATVFFAHALRNFVRPDGVLAFVMPRSVLTGAKQHTRFQAEYGLSMILDLQAVTPLFEVPACVLISRPAEPKTPSVATIEISGALPRRNAPWSQARTFLSESAGTFTPLAPLTRHSPYYEEFHQGAILVPRVFWFVRSPSETLLRNPGRPQLETDPDLDANAKRPWKGLRVQGAVEAEFLYASVLSEDLLPFRLRGMRLVVVPVLEEIVGVAAHPNLRPMNGRAAAERGFTGLSDWLRQVDHFWIAFKKETAEDDLVERLDTLGNLTRQGPATGFKVLYNTSGSNIASSVIDVATLRTLDGVSIRGLVADAATYWFSTPSRDEAYYLAAFLNAPFVDAAIKPYQPRGQFGAGQDKGERHVHRRPFEVVPIPRFDPENQRHRLLASIALECEAKASTVAQAAEGRVGPARQRVRAELHAELAIIDELAREIVGELTEESVPPDTQPGLGLVSPYAGEVGA